MMVQDTVLCTLQYEFSSFLGGRSGVADPGLHFVALEVPLLRVLWLESLGADVILD